MQNASDAMNKLVKEEGKDVSSSRRKKKSVCDIVEPAIRKTWSKGKNRSSLVFFMILNANAILEPSLSAYQGHIGIDEGVLTIMKEISRHR